MKVEVEDEMVNGGKHIEVKLVNLDVAMKVAMPVHKAQSLQWTRLSEDRPKIMQVGGGACRI